MIPLHSRAMFILPSEAKNNRLGRFGHYFAGDLVIILPPFGK